MVASSMNRQNTSQHTSKVESVGVRSRLPHQDVGHAIGMRRSPALGFRARYRDCAVSEQFAKAAAEQTGEVERSSADPASRGCVRASPGRLSEWLTVNPGRANAMPVGVFPGQFGPNSHCYLLSESCVVGLE